MFTGTFESFSGLFSDKRIVEALFSRAYGLLCAEADRDGFAVDFALDDLSADLFIIQTKQPWEDDGTVVELPCIVVTLPQPQSVLEAYMLGICPMKPLDSLRESEAHKEHILFATLEVAAPETSPSRTVLGRWYRTEKGPRAPSGFKQTTYGGGPPPQDPYQFVEYVERLACVLRG